MNAQQAESDPDEEAVLAASGVAPSVSLSSDLRAVLFSPFE